MKNQVIPAISIEVVLLSNRKAIRMKIRIKGNSVRIRLTRSEVAELCEKGVIREKTYFPKGAFTYEVLLSQKDESLRASIEDNLIRLYLPQVLAENWPNNETVGFEEFLPLENGDALHLLLEKDFQCLEVRSEDESDQYPNPNAIL